VTGRDDPGAAAAVPDWAAGLADGAPPALVAAAVRLLATGWATPERVARAIRPRLEAGLAPTAGDVLEALLAQRRADTADNRAVADRDLADRAADRLAAGGARVQVVGCAGYPQRLASAWPELGAPVWLAVRSPGGRLPEGPAVAIVGTRHPTHDGLHTATELGRLLARHAVTVVSGMARGIDQAAHRGALEAGGSTVGVLGTGFDVDYPHGDGALRVAVAASGGLVTELAPWAPPRPPHFLARNRVVSGLADLVVVVEGRARSGAQQTARLAAAQGRDVWAVPGSINAPTSRAPLDLIRDGAQTVTRLQDVLDAVAPAQPALWVQGQASAEGPGHGEPRPTAGLDPVTQRVLGVLAATPATPGTLARAAGVPLPAALAAVAELTARGLARTTPRGVVAG
jgi:DNA processing protein